MRRGIILRRQPRGSLEHASEGSSSLSSMIRHAFAIRAAFSHSIEGPSGLQALARPEAGRPGAFQPVMSLRARSGAAQATSIAVGCLVARDNTRPPGIMSPLVLGCDNRRLLPAIMQLNVLGVGDPRGTGSATDGGVGFRVLASVVAIFFLHLSDDIWSDDAASFHLSHSAPCFQIRSPAAEMGNAPFHDRRECPVRPPNSGCAGSVQKPRTTA